MLGDIKKAQTEDGKKEAKIDKGSGWVTAREMANSMGLPAAVNLDNILSSKEYEKKVVNGIGYYKKK